MQLWKLLNNSMFRFEWIMVLIFEHWVQDSDHTMHESPAAQHWVSLVNERGFDTRTNFHYRNRNAGCNFNEAFS